MPYEEELKRRAVDAYRNSDRSLRDIAAEFGVATSTVSRWNDQLPVQEQTAPYPSLDSELVSVVTRLGRTAEGGIGDYARGERHMKHSIYASSVLFLVLCGMVGFFIGFSGLRLYFEQPKEVRSQEALSWLWLVITVVVAVLGIDAMHSILVKRFFPLPYVVEQLHSAESALMNHTGQEIFLVSPFNLVRKLQRRRIKKCMNRAGRVLSRRTVSGHHYDNPEAQEIDFTRRSRAASSLAIAEMQLQQKGKAAYTEVTQRLRTLMILTVLKDWNLPDLPESTDAAKAYNTWPKRFARWLGKAIGTSATALGAIQTLVGSPQIPEVLRKVQEGSHLAFLPW